MKDEGSSSLAQKERSDSTAIYLESLEKEIVKRLTIKELSVFIKSIRPSALNFSENQFDENPMSFCDKKRKVIKDTLFDILEKVEKNASEALTASQNMQTDALDRLAAGKKLESLTALQGVILDLYTNRSGIVIDTNPLIKSLRQRDYSILETNKDEVPFSIAAEVLNILANQYREVEYKFFLQKYMAHIYHDPFAIVVPKEFCLLALKAAHVAIPANMCLEEYKPGTKNSVSHKVKFKDEVLAIEIPNRAGGDWRMEGTVVGTIRPDISEMDQNEEFIIKLTLNEKGRFRGGDTSFYHRKDSGYWSALVEKAEADKKVTFKACTYKD